MLFELQGHLNTFFLVLFFFFLLFLGQKVPLFSINNVFIMNFKFLNFTVMLDFLFNIKPYTCCLFVLVALVLRIIFFFFFWKILLIFWRICWHCIGMKYTTRRVNSCEIHHESMLNCFVSCLPIFCVKPVMIGFSWFLKTNRITECN